MVSNRMLTILWLCYGASFEFPSLTTVIAEFLNQEHGNALRDLHKLAENNNLRMAQFCAMRKASKNRDRIVYYFVNTTA